jgi:catechol 2,3-dioxygenase-like lactoylglutathione lyase family enzyme
MASQFSHRGICVENIDVAKNFYVDALQFAPAEDYGYLSGEWLERGTDVKAIDVRPLMLRNSQGTTLELLHFRRPGTIGPRGRRPMNQYGLTHLAFLVDDLDATAAKVERAGGQVLRDTRVFYADNNAAIMYCVDPDGVRIELVSVQGVTAAFSHSGMCVEDMAVSAAFYAVLGFKPDRSHDFTRHSAWLAPLTELPACKLLAEVVRDAKGNAIEFMKILEPKSFGPKERRPLNQYGLTHHCFMVDDIDSTALELSRQGGRVFPHTRGRHGDMEMLHLADPDGVRVELMKDHAAA